MALRRRRPERTPDTPLDELLRRRQARLDAAREGRGQPKLATGRSHQIMRLDEGGKIGELFEASCSGCTFRFRGPWKLAHAALAEHVCGQDAPARQPH